MNAEDGENINHSLHFLGKWMRLVSKAQIKKANLIPQKTGFLEDWPVKSKKTEEGRKKGERNRRK